MIRFAVWAAVLAPLVLVASGCACDAEHEARRLAGSRATDCGFAQLDGDMGAVTDCLDAAIASETHAYGGWALPGTTGFRQYYVVRPDRTYELFQSAEDRMTISPCLGAPVRVDDTYTCDGELQDPYEFCD